MIDPAVSSHEQDSRVIRLAPNFGTAENRQGGPGVDEGVGEASEKGGVDLLGGKVLYNLGVAGRVFHSDGNTDSL